MCWSIWFDRFAIRVFHPKENISKLFVKWDVYKQHAWTRWPVVGELTTMVIPTIPKNMILERIGDFDIHDKIGFRIDIFLSELTPQSNKG